MHERNNSNLLGADTRTRTGDLRITNALLYQLSHIGNPFTSCTPAGARTLDTLIKSQVLYQLSYGCNQLFKKKGGSLSSSLCILCTPAGARTLDTLIKSQVLYQLSYGCILFLSGCKGTYFLRYNQTFCGIFSKKSIIYHNADSRINIF